METDALPTFQDLMLPTLQELARSAVYSRAELRSNVAKRLHLSDSQLKMEAPNNRGSIYATRFAWAIAYLKQAALLSYVKRGVYEITPRGREALDSNPCEINVRYLRRYPEFVEFLARSTQTSDGDSEKAAALVDQEVATTQTPVEQIQAGYSQFLSTLGEQLLDRIKEISPSAFERLVVKVIVALGYGGSEADAAAEVVGRSGDGGIDGVINEDRLGLDRIYIQAKLWKDTKVGRPAIQQFAGALQGQNARKGIFITTSSFSKEASEYARSIPASIVLIDGRRLVDLMIAAGIGISEVQIIKLSKIDEDFFDEATSIV